MVFYFLFFEKMRAAGRFMQRNYMFGAVFEKVYSGYVFYRIENGKAGTETGRWFKRQNLRRRNK